MILGKIEIFSSRKKLCTKFLFLDTYCSKRVSYKKFRKIKIEEILYRLANVVYLDF